MHKTLGGSDKLGTGVVGCFPFLLLATISLDKGWRAAAGSWVSGGF